MKFNLTNNQSQQNYFFRIDDGYLFTRSETKENFNKLAKGRQELIILYSEIETRKQSIEALLNHGRLEKTYNLPENFDFNCNCFEFVIIKNFYENIHRNLVKILTNNPKATFKDILNSEDLRRRYKSPKTKGRVGRRKVYRDQSTSEIIGMKLENKKIIELWEAGNDFEPIRFAVYPKTKTPPKKRAEISKIKRKLRTYNYLLERKYDRK